MEVMISVSMAAAVSWRNKVSKAGKAQEVDGLGPVQLEVYSWG